jgi:iron complex outermembrane receptor protein
MFRYYDKFGYRVIRGPVDPATPNLPGPIVGIDTSLINLGTTQTSGIDASFSWNLPRSEYGNFRIGLQGTYVLKWETQIDGVNYVSMLGDATHGAPIPRWRSTLSLDWNLGPWGTTLAQVYSSGYTDQYPGINQGPRNVGASSTWDLQGRYSGFSSWQLAAGVQNLFDEEPPFSNQGNTFQVGYNPQVSSPLGRVFYVRVGYSYK